MISYSIFVVDDEPSARNGITLALQPKYSTRGFANAEDALAAMVDTRPDLVLLDIGLPGMSGIEALQHIR
ncbi:MAG: response regulator, partial [Deltaproteobacteria bacterium]|nr:response regulator [Deltaproteobacteria bacterium]